MPAPMKEEEVRQILVAGIGNIFKADDAFGCEVARHLEARSLGSSVKVRDFGIRGLELAYTLLDGGYELVVLVDTIRRGGSPGTLYVIEPDVNALEELGGQNTAPDAHGMHPFSALAWAQAMGARLPTIRLVGCEPEDLASGGDGQDMRMGLSARVSASVEEAARMVQTLIGGFLQEAHGRA